MKRTKKKPKRCARKLKRTNREIKLLVKERGLIAVLSGLERERRIVMRDSNVDEGQRVDYHRRVLQVASKAISMAEGSYSLKGCGWKGELEGDDE